MINLPRRQPGRKRSPRAGLWLLLAVSLALAPVDAAWGAVRPLAVVPAATLAPSGVVAGPHDTLSRLAVRFHAPAAAIARANHLAGPLTPLTVGQTIVNPLLAPDPDQRQIAPPHAQLLAALPPPAQLNHLGTPRVVLADYMMWYAPSTFDGSQTFDIPAAGPYDSGDLSTIQRQLSEAKRACLDGFTAHWFGPQDPVTTTGFDKLLKMSATTNMQHALVLLTNSWPYADEQSMITAIQYAKDHWVNDPHYLKLGGRPLLLFTDMSRLWGGTDGQAAVLGWQRIRAATDPDHKMIWMAEGLYTLYNPLFDGLYVYRIDHRDYPQSWLKQPRFANLLRGVEAQGNLPIGGLYWADTIAPGYDDTHSVNAIFDVRSPQPTFARDRRDGAYYDGTFAVTAQSNGDFLLVKSFNEWVEGTAIEPSVSYGTRYLDQTCQFANTYRTR